jgi:hypothetical protein
MKTLLFFLLSILSLSSRSQNHTPPEYRLLDSFEHADLNYNQIDSINSIGGGIAMLDSVFNVVPGKYTIYRFMTYDRGILFDDFESDINELIILKVNSTGRIVDGYYYLLQTPEMPLSCFLYKITQKRRKKDVIKIDSLKFKRVNTTLNEYQVCNELELFLIDARALKFKN